MKGSNRKLDFIVVGCQKAGTTSLHTFFRDMEVINLPKLKETNYWDYLYGSELSGYFELFEDMKPHHLIRGEVAPHYWLSLDAAKRLSQHFPNVKIVVVVRRPVDRAYSAYNMYQKAKRYDDYTKQDFERTLFLESKGELEKNLLLNGNYNKYLKPFLSHFRPENVLIVRFDSLIKLQDETLTRIAEFIGCPSELKRPMLRKENAAGIPKSGLVFALMNAGFLSTFLRKVSEGLRIHSFVKTLLLSPPIKLSPDDKNRLSKKYFEGHDLKLDFDDAKYPTSCGFRVL